MKKIGILGAGESGTGAALLAQSKGYSVFVSDKGEIQSPYREELIKHKISFEEGKHSLEDLLGCDFIIKSPGIPYSVPVVQTLQEAEIPILDELEFASRFTDAFIIAITGSNGKTTTSNLIYHLLKEAGLRVGLAGNVGNSFARQVIEDPYTHFVIEVSSFQLEGMFQFKADIALLLNITPDHLDRYHHDMAQYVAAKFRILQNMTHKDHFIYSKDDAQIAQSMSGKEIQPHQYPVSLSNNPTTCSYATEQALVINHRDKPFSIPMSKVPLLGKHNQMNVMMAVMVAELLGIPRETILLALSTFEGVPHRLEKVDIIDGITFYNDSKATNVESAYAALETIPKPIIWIAGGVDKGNDYTSLIPLVQRKVKALICLGKDNEKLRSTFEPYVSNIFETEKMEKVIEKALSLGSMGDSVLLAPACSSFDLFHNFEERGDIFKKAIKQAQKETKG